MSSGTDSVVSSTLQADTDGRDPSRRLDAEYSLFGVLYTLTKEKPRMSLRQAMSIVGIDFLQLAAFCLVLPQLAPFFEWVELRALFRVAGWTTYAVCFVLWSSFLASAVAVCAYVGYCFKHDHFPYLWPIKVLRNFLGFFFSTFYVSSVNFFLISLDCMAKDGGGSVLRLFPDRDCWAGGVLIMQAIAALLGLCFFTISLLLALAKFDLDPRSRQPLAANDSGPAIRIFLLRTIMSLCATFVRAQQTLLLGVLTFCTFEMTRQIVVVQPHYVRLTNQVRAGLYGVLFAGSALQLFGHAVSGDRNAPYVAWGSLALVVPTMIGAAGAVVLRGRLLSRHLSEEHQRRSARVEPWSDNPEEGSTHFVQLQSPLEAELLTRFMRDPSLRQSSHRFAHAVDQAHKVYKAAVRQFPDHSVVRLLYANFLEYYCRDVQGCLVQVEEARRLRPLPQYRFMLFIRDTERTRAQKAQSVGQGSMDLVSYVEFQSQLRRAIRMHKKAFGGMRAFWKRAVAARGRMQGESMGKMLRALHSYEIQAERTYNTLLTKYPRSVKLLRSYGLFQMEIKNDEERAQRLFAKADALEDEEAAMGKGGEGVGDGTAEGAAAAIAAGRGPRDGRASGVVILTVGGVVKHADPAARKLLGQPRSRFVGTPVAALLAPPLCNHPAELLGERGILEVVEIAEFKSAPSRPSGGPEAAAAQRVLRVAVDATGDYAHPENAYGMVLSHAQQAPAPAIALVEADGTVVAASAAFSVLFGHAGEDMSGMALGSLLDEGSRAGSPSPGTGAASAPTLLGACADGEGAQAFATLRQGGCALVQAHRGPALYLVRATPTAQLSLLLDGNGRIVNASQEARRRLRGAPSGQGLLGATLADCIAPATQAPSPQVSGSFLGGQPQPSDGVIAILATMEETRTTGSGDSGEGGGGEGGEPVRVRVVSTTLRTGGGGGVSGGSTPITVLAQLFEDSEAEAQAKDADAPLGAEAEEPLKEGDGDVSSTGGAGSESEGEGENSAPAITVSGGEGKEEKAAAGVWEAKSASGPTAFRVQKERGPKGGTPAGTPAAGVRNSEGKTRGKSRRALRRAAVTPTESEGENDTASGVDEDRSESDSGSIASSASRSMSKRRRVIRRLVRGEHLRGTFQSTKSSAWIIFACAVATGVLDVSLVVTNSSEQRHSLWRIAMAGHAANELAFVTGDAFVFHDANLGRGSLQVPNNETAESMTDAWEELEEWHGNLYLDHDHMTPLLRAGYIEKEYDTVEHVKEGGTFRRRVVRRHLWEMVAHYISNGAVVTAAGMEHGFGTVQSELRYLIDNMVVSSHAYESLIDLELENVLAQSSDLRAIQLVTIGLQLVVLAALPFFLFQGIHEMRRQRDALYYVMLSVPLPVLKKMSKRRSSAHDLDSGSDQDSAASSDESDGGVADPGKGKRGGGPPPTTNASPKYASADSGTGESEVEAAANLVARTGPTMGPSTRRIRLDKALPMGGEVPLREDSDVDIEAASMSIETDAPGAGSTAAAARPAQVEPLHLVKGEAGRHPQLKRSRESWLASKRADVTLMHTSRGIVPWSCCGTPSRAGAKPKKPRDLAMLWLYVGTITSAALLGTTAFSRHTRALASAAPLRDVHASAKVFSLASRMRTLSSAFLIVNASDAEAQALYAAGQAPTALGHQSIRTELLSLNERTVRYHRAILYGDEELGLQGCIERSAAQQAIYFGKECLRDDKASCLPVRSCAAPRCTCRVSLPLALAQESDVAYVPTHSGLHTALEFYQLHVDALAHMPDELVSFTLPEFRYIWRVAKTDTHDGLLRSMWKFLDESYVELDSLVLTISLTSGLYLIALAAVYRAVFEPYMARILLEAARAAIMLSFLPTPVIQARLKAVNRKLQGRSAWNDQL